MASLLCILDQGYRATVEEQDDTAIWMAHMLARNEGTTTTIVLRSSAVNYANKARQPVPVSFGDWTQAHPADLARDLDRYAADGGRVFVVREDLEARGLGKADLIDGVDVIGSSEIAGLASEADHISFW